MEETLIDFLLELNAKGLINDYDLDYEKEAKDFVKKTKKKQLTLTEVGCSWPSKEEVTSELRQLDKRWELSENEDEKQAFNHGFRTCLRWLKNYVK